MINELIKTEIARMEEFKDRGYERDNETINLYINHFEELAEQIKKQLPSKKIILSDMNTWCETSESIVNVMKELGYFVDEFNSNFDNYVWVFKYQ